MTNASAIRELDHASLDEIMIRWKLAELHVADVPMQDLPCDHAVRLLVRRDVPTLLQELIRLRPDLV
jgi:hypothetical protein